MGKPRVVASFTTMPSSYPKIGKMLQSLHAQTYKLDAIYLSLPWKSRRLGTDYPELPQEVKDLCTVVRCSDFGPITKILGGLLAEKDPDTVIITIDDDMVYPPTMVERLMKHHLSYPDSALGSSGMLVRYKCPACAITPNEDNPLYRIPKFVVPKEGRRVDSIYGYPGALYVRKFFPKTKHLEEDFLNYALINHDTLMNDDVVISGYLSLKKVERRIFPDMPVVDFVKEEGVRQRVSSEISYNLELFFSRMNGAIEQCKKMGMYAVTEPMDISESIVGISLIIILCLLILICLTVYLVRAEDWMIKIMF
jgi:hypothetical protein